jgi:protein gp37
MSAMRKSKIGYTGIGADGRPVDWMYGWNPGGFGCSANCDGCWSKAMPFKGNCPDCQAFRVHLHPERLGQPAATKKPGIVLCNFTNDWMDPERPDCDVGDVLGAMIQPHIYITLTKRYSRLGSICIQCPPGETVYHGITVRNQDDADAAWGNGGEWARWVSLEPLQENVACHWSNYCGVLIGHDNRRGAPGTDTLAHVRSVVQQCQAAGVPVYVKQLWVGPGKPTLAHDPSQFPPDLRLRNLPWSIPITDTGNGECFAFRKDMT